MMKAQRARWAGLVAGLATLAVAAACSPVTAPGANPGLPTPAATPPAPAPAATAAQQPAAQTETPAAAATGVRPGFTVIPEAPVNGNATPEALDPSTARLVQGAKEDLARRTGLGVDAIGLVEARSVTWPNGALGCPQPDMAYIEVLVDGILIRLTAGGRVYEYHGGGSRAPFLCENPAGGTPAPGSGGGSQ